MVKKGKNPILTFSKIQTNKNKRTNKQSNKQTNMVRRKIRTQFLLLKKKSRGKEKSKNLILNFSKKSQE